MCMPPYCGLGDSLNNLWPEFQVSVNSSDAIIMLFQYIILSPAYISASFLQGAVKSSWDF